MSRTRLPAIKFNPMAGLVTKANPLLVAQNGLVTAQNVDTFEEYGSLSKVPGSTRVSDDAGASWHSLHYFEHYNLANVLQRYIIGLAGTNLVKINSNRSLSTLKAGLFADPMTGVVASDRLHLTSPLNDPIKVDSGNVVSRWGVTPPGSERLMLESFDDSTDWTPTDCAVSNADGIDGSDGSVACAKSDVTVTNVSFEKTTGFGVENVGRYNFISIFIPEGVLELLSTSASAWGATTALVVSAQISGYDPFGLHTFWFIPRSSLTEGRNLILLDALEGYVGGTLWPSVPTGPVVAMTVQINTISAASTFSDVRIDDFYATDQGFVEAALSATAGDATGSVTYRVTYVSKYGQESNAGPVSAALDLGTTPSAIDLTNIPVSYEPQVIARRIYRDLEGDSIWRFVDQIDDNTTTTYTDTLSFDSLSAETCPLAGESEQDYSRPRKMQQVISWNGFLLGIDGYIKNQVNFSYKNRPESWPITRRVSFQYTVTALIPFPLGVLINGKDRCTVLKGTDWSNFTYEETLPDQSVGVSGWRAFTVAKTVPVIWHDVGPYLHTLYDPWYMGNPIKDQIEDLDAELFEDLIAVHDRLNFRILFFTGTNHRTIYSWGYGRDLRGGVISPEGSGVDPLDLRRGDFRTLSLPTGINPTCFAVVERPGDRPECWMGCDDGYVYWLGDPSATNYANGIGEDAIEADAEWEWVVHPEGVDMVGRFLCLVMKSTTDSTWTWTVKSSEDIEGTATMTATGTLAVNGVKEAQIPMPAGVQGAYLKIRLQNSALGETGIIREANLEIIPRREQREE